MQYIKSIAGGVRSANFDLFVDKPVLVTIHDTETKSEAVIDAKELLYEFVVGVGVMSTNGVVVQHTTKTAMLHKHIPFAETNIGGGMTRFPHSDYCTIVDGERYSFSNGADEHETLNINIQDNSPEVAGLLGSVVRYIPRFAANSRFCTLYDYLGYLCRSTGMNIFSYQKLHLFSELRSISTVIKLSETDEAKRFFMKMYLDVTRSDAS